MKNRFIYFGKSSYQVKRFFVQNSQILSPFENFLMGALGYIHTNCVFYVGLSKVILDTKTTRPFLIKVISIDSLRLKGYLKLIC